MNSNSNNSDNSSQNNDNSGVTCTSNCRCISLDFVKNLAACVKKEHERLNVRQLETKPHHDRLGAGNEHFWVYRCVHIFKQVPIDFILLGKEVLTKYVREVEYDELGLRQEVSL